jgi:hypothetical protein
MFSDILPFSEPAVKVQVSLWVITVGRSLGFPLRPYRRVRVCTSMRSEFMSFPYRFCAALVSPHETIIKDPKCQVNFTDGFAAIIADSASFANSADRFANNFASDSSHQNCKGAAPKSERVRRTWISSTSLVTYLQRPDFSNDLNCRSFDCVSWIRFCDRSTCSELPCQR